MNKFVEKANKKFGNKFDYSQAVYISANVEIDIICPIHGMFKQKPSNHLDSKYGCKKCSIEILNSPEYLKNKFIKKANIKFNNKFDYSKVDYVNSQTKVKIICPEHGEFEQTPDTHLNSKYGCKKCFKRSNKIPLEQLIDSAKNKHHNQFDYSLITDSMDLSAKVPIICKLHGVFMQSFRQHMLCTICCPECVNISNRKKYRQTFEAFKEKANHVHNNKYDYSNIDWDIVKNSTDKVPIICPIHGEFNQVISVHSSGHGCPKCGNNISTQNEFIIKANIIHNNKYDYSNTMYESNEKVIDIICPTHGKFTQLPYVHLQGSGCPKCANITSSAELKIVSWFKDNYSNINIIQNDRNIIKPLELDIIFPEYNTAIEYDGILWHSYGTGYPNNFSALNKKYHLNKTNLVEEKGYQLFHIFENEWLNPIKKKIWQSIIQCKLNMIPKDNVIFARKCHIRKISSNDAKIFLEYNHMQGSRHAKVNLGLFYQDKLISLMTFGASAFNKKYEYELIRFCSKINHRVIGGASKLLKYFERNYNPKSIVTYANRRWSQGGLYRALDFTFLHNSEPNYFYVKHNTIYSRNLFQKHMLKDKLELFDENLTELQNMINNGYRIIYDCGNKVYSKEYK